MSVRRYPDRPVAAAGGVIVSQGRLLLISRRKPPAAGQWTFPGGVIRLGESGPEAVRREVEEECGLEVRVGEPFCVADVIACDAEGAILYHYLIVNYLARPQGQIVKAQSDAAEVRWVGPWELEDLALTASTRELVPRLKELLVAKGRSRGLE